MRHLPLLLALAISPAAAHEPVFAGFMTEALAGRYANDGTVEQRQTPRVGLIQTGDFDITLEVTPIRNVLFGFGGLFHETTGASGHVLWICYQLPDGTAWFVSDGTLEDGAITGLGVQMGLTDPAWGCTVAPFIFRYLQLDMPGTRASAAELEAAFRPFTPDAEGRFGFASEAPHPTRPDATIVQNYIYRMGANGKTDAVAIVQSTRD